MARTGHSFFGFSLLRRSTACCSVSPGLRWASASVNSFSVSLRPSTRPSLRPSSFSLLLKIRDITMATLPTLSITIAIAKDAPEMSATEPTGLCESHSSPYQNATTEQTTNENRNRPQNAPPIVLTFSRTESPIDLTTLVSQPRILSPYWRLIESQFSANSLHGMGWPTMCQDCHQPPASIYSSSYQPPNAWMHSSANSRYSLPEGRYYVLAKQLY